MTAHFTSNDFPFLKMGISLFHEIQQPPLSSSSSLSPQITGGNILSHLSIPGGLFTLINPNPNPNPNQDEDHTKINVIEDFDKFIDLVSEREASIKKNKSRKLTKKLK
jgi:hypothetical protein